jgi:hypothetical protein
MADLSPGLVPQFTKQEEGNQDILYQILIELKKINTQLSLMTDTLIEDEKAILDKSNIEDVF